MSAGATSRAGDGRAPARALQDSKLRVPPARRDSVSRASLAREARDSGSRVVAVVAPAGYGKSTLLTEWARSDDRAVIWASLDSGDDDPSALLTLLATACVSVVPALAELVGDMRGLGETALSRSAPLLASLLSTAQQPFVLFVDDAHLANSPGCRDVLEVVLGGIPDGSQVVLASRHRLLHLARIRATGDLFEVDTDDLRLNAREARTLFEGNAMSESDLEKLVARCEGWPVGLFLCALMSIRGEGPRAISGGDRHISDYLYRECLASLSEPLRHFLLRASVLDELTPDLCDTVLGDHSSAARIRELEDLNLFLVRLDREGGGWYRFHALFREFLLSELTVDDQTVAADLHRRAARWYEEHEMPVSAINHWLAADERDEAARLIASILLTTWRSGQLALIDRWMAELGDPVIARHPEVATLAAWMALLQGRSVDSARWLNVIDRSAPERRTEDWFVSGRAMIDSVMCIDGPESALRNAAIALELEPAWSPWWGPVRYLQGASQLLMGNVEAARSTFTAGAEGAGTIFNAAALAVLSADEGNWAEASVHAAAAVGAVEAGHMEGYSTTALALAVSARVAIQRGDFAEGDRYLAKAMRVRVICTYLVPFYSVAVRLQIAKAYYAKSDRAGVMVMLGEIEGIVRRRPHLGTLVGDVDAFRHVLATSAHGRTNTTPLTPAELRVLPYLQTHLTMSDVAHRLVVSRNTVSTQVTAIYRKLGVNSRAEAVERATGLGMLGA